MTALSDDDDLAIEIRLHKLLADNRLSEQHKQHLNSIHQAYLAGTPTKLQMGVLAHLEALYPPEEAPQPWTPRQATPKETKPMKAPQRKNRIQSTQGDEDIIYLAKHLDKLSSQRRDKAVNLIEDYRMNEPKNQLTEPQFKLVSDFVEQIRFMVSLSKSGQ